MDDEKGKSKSTDKDDKTQSSLENPLSDGVVHDAEAATCKGWMKFHRYKFILTQEGIASKQEDELNPSQANTNSCNDL